MQASKIASKVKKVIREIPNTETFYKGDIYRGNEKIAFQERHRIYKTLLKLEFEEAIRDYMKKKTLK